MIDFTIETEIRRPVSEVFAHVIDPAKLHTWQTNTVSAKTEGGGPVGLGSRVREVHRTPVGKEISELVEFWQFAPDHMFSMRIVEGPLPIDGSINFEPFDGGTRMRFRVYGRLKGAMRIAEPIMRLALKRQFAKDCATLKRVMESGA
jgi:uncharacterized protein YndB with AHSA1/START domain